MNVSKELQTYIKTTVSSFQHMFNEALDLENLYWKGSVSTDITAAAGGDPVTQSTQLTKTQVTNLLTLSENVRKFFDNAALATSDYMTTCENSIYGNATATFLTNNVEAFGNRAVQLARDCITQHKRAKEIENIYNSSQLGAVAGVISAQTIVFGSDMTQDQLTSAITVMQNWQTFLNNGAAGTSDRKVTLAKWYSL